MSIVPILLLALIAGGAAFRQRSTPSWSHRVSSSLHSSSSPSDSQSSLQNIQSQSASFTSPLDIQLPIEKADFSSPKSPLVIFVVDTSSPGGAQRIDAVKGAVQRLMPSTKVAVISCLYNSATVILEPTSSFVTASYKLKKMQKSVMGFLTGGLNCALELTLNQFKEGNEAVLLTVVADGKAHGLTTSSSATGCGLEELDAKECDHELFQTATTIADQARLLSNAEGKPQKLKTLVVDTAKLVSKEWSEEGLRLSLACEAEYHLSPSLNQESLYKYVTF